jgi:hypothetical protein
MIIQGQPINVAVTQHIPNYISGCGVFFWAIAD